jgi:glycosyltransferase involved in cell wall biosynthesis
VAPVIAIDASRTEIRERTGTETYSVELLRAMAAHVPDDWDVHLYARRFPSDIRDTVAALGNMHAIPFPRLWTHVRLATSLARLRPDLLFVPSHVIPLVHPPSVVTVHDLGFVHEPEAHTTSQRRMLDLTTRWNARVARHIIAISETTKRDLIDLYGVSPERVTVIHHGVGAQFRPQPADEIIRVRDRYNLPDTFVLAVGTVQPRKNLARLAMAVRTLRETNPDLHLVVAGKRGWKSDEVIRDIEHALPGDAVRLLNYVDGSDLPALYAASACTALVSTYEGFGLPVIEAMASGAAVVASDTPALIEVAGGAAEVVPATDVTGIAAGIGRVLGSPDQYRTDGTTWAANFTWGRTAQHTIGVLDREARRAPL